MGDPTEANWVGEKFQRDGDLVIGSVKGNIGWVSLSPSELHLTVRKAPGNIRIFGVTLQSLFDDAD